MSGNCIAEPVTLADWQKILEDLGFEHKYYDYLDCELIGVDWYKEEEHILVRTCHSKEYDEYLRGLPIGTEFETDWSRCLVVGIEISTDEFAYPEATRGCFEDSWHGHISLYDTTMYQNFAPLKLDYFKKALWMSRHPIQAKKEIVRKFLDECDIFFSKFGDLMTRLGYKEESNSLLQVGCEIFETEPYIAFSHKNAYNIGDESFLYNMFTEKLVYVRGVPSKEKWKGTEYFQLNVNEMTTSELESELRESLKYWNIKID